MRTLDLQQGTDAWLAHRRTTRNASEASVMMGALPSMSRRELVRLQATGMEREYSDYVQKFILDRGHEVEPALRAFAEGIIGEDLFPITGVSDDGYLGASFDGVSLDEGFIFEAKQASEPKFAYIENDEIPPSDYWQLVQQFAVCESAHTCIYCVGDGSTENTRYLTIPRSRIQASIPKLLAGWTQFETDVREYVPEAVAAPVVGAAPDSLPALSIQVTGMVTASNLAEFKAHALSVLGNINRELRTDEDFANAERTVKWCSGVEDRLKATKDQVLAQTADIEAVFRTIDDVSAETRRIRLELDKLVKAEKENRKTEIVQQARTAYSNHLEMLKAETNQVWIALAAPDFAGAIKGKRTLSSMKDAVDSVLAHAKIDASESALHIRTALACLTEETDGHKHLFPDYQSFIAKPIEDIRALVRGRIAEHQRREADRLEQERARIRQEEADKLRRETEAAATKPEPAVEAAPEVAETSTPEPATTPTPPPSAVQQIRSAPAPAAVVSTAKIKLGDVNARIAPLTVSADGLTQLGFPPAAKERGATLYREADFPAICQAMAQVLVSAAQKKAA